MFGSWDRGDIGALFEIFVQLVLICLSCDFDAGLKDDFSNLV